MPSNENREKDRSSDASEIVRVHERLDDVLFELQKIAAIQGEIAASCGPCKAKVAAMDITLNGNGLPGLKQRLAVLEDSRTDQDTLSIKAILWLLGAIGTLATAVATAIATASSHIHVTPQ
jgi:hypothetical protein